MIDSNNIHPIQKWPERNPLDLVPVISSYVKDKIVCDIGCGAGDLLYEMKRLGLTDDIIGIEKDKWVHESIKEFKINDREFLINADFTSMDIPEADVYLIWVGFVQYAGIINRLPKSCLVIDFSQGGDRHSSVMTNKLNQLEKIEYDYDESKYENKGILKNGHSSDWKQIGKRIITIYEMKKD